MTSIRKWFYEFRHIWCGSVLPGNDEACKVKDIGSVKIKMHGVVIRELADLRYQICA